MKISKVGAVLIIIALAVIIVPIFRGGIDKGLALGLFLLVIAMIVDNRILARRKRKDGNSK
jgi:hypothetical protein